MRLQLALNVPDLERAIAYYTDLFATPPHKRRAGYANFAVDKPPLKLVLFENPSAAEHLNHLGVEVFTPQDLAQASSRLAAAGMLDETEVAQTCCHATQDKVWSTGPGGLRWEWYRITDDDPSNAPDATACCGERRRVSATACCA